MAVNTLGPSMGVGFGGILSEIVGWRMLFLGPFLPLFLIWVISFLVLPADGMDAVQQSPRRAASAKPAGDQTFDYAGALVFGCCMMLLLLSVNRGNDLGWGSPFIIGSACGSLVLAVVLHQIEKRAINPIIPSFLFTDRTIALANFLPMPAGMAYMGSMINLPIFLEQACGLTPAFIGMLIFVRPGFGSLMSTMLGRVMGKPDHWLTKIRMVRIGGCVALSSYFILALGAQVIAAAPNLAGPIVIFTLFLQACGSFSVFLGGNAIVLERVPEENLSNVSAIRNMMSQMASTMAAAVGLSIVRLGGSPSDPSSYYPLWAMLIGLSMVTVVLSFCLDAGKSNNFSEVSQRDDEDEEASQYDDRGDEKGEEHGLLNGAKKKGSADGSEVMAP